MTFGASIATCFQKYATFTGRATRSEFWWFFLFNVIVSFVASFADSLLGVGGLGDGYGPASVLATLVLFVPGLAVSVRRLHDINRTGWWLLISLVPCIGVIVLIVFLCSASSPRDNDFGPRPLA